MFQSLVIPLAPSTLSRRFHFAALLGAALLVGTCTHSSDGHAPRSAVELSCTHSCNRYDWARDGSTEETDPDHPWRYASVRICYQQIGSQGVGRLSQVAAPLVKKLDFCRLARSCGPGSGIYLVEAIVGVPGATVPSSSSQTATYVELSLIRPWVDPATTSPVLRFGFGPIFGCSQYISTSDMPTLRLGEEVGLLFWPQAEGSDGFRTLSNQNIWRQRGDGWSNGSYFVKADQHGSELAALLNRAIQEGDACSIESPQDPPDGTSSSAADSGPDGVWSLDSGEQPIYPQMTNDIGQHETNSRAGSCSAAGL